MCSWCAAGGLCFIEKTFFFFVFDAYEKCESVITGIGPADRLVDRTNVRPGKTLNAAIFSDTMNGINVRHCMMALRELYTFIPLWPWVYFKVTTVPNSFYRKFYVLIRLSWNFVWLFIMSSSSWIYRYFSFYHMFKGDNWRWFEKRPLMLPFSQTLL